MKIKGYFERILFDGNQYEPDRDDYPKEDIFYYECQQCKSQKIMHSYDTKYCLDCLSIDIWCRKHRR